jgi:glyoxylase-like metal-dependent hydrolase (beta-lactamase superfamily II)
VDELRPGLWTWTAPHPDWDETRDASWGPDVRSYALVRGEHVILFDPVDPPRELLEGRDGEVVLTAEWHSRSAGDLALPVRGHGDPLPDGIVEQPGFYPEERSLWIAEHGALIAGDSLPDGGPAPDPWLGKTSRADYNAKLCPLLELPVELVLATHGDPVFDDARARLAAALGQPTNSSRTSS